jgi:hypothetical protein
MPFRFTISGLLLTTAIVAGSAALVRVGGFGLGIFVFLLFSGICLLIRSDWASTVEDRIFLILMGLGLLAAAAFMLLMPAIH